jgi:protein TonB
MTAVAIEDRGDLGRWVASAVLVLGLHAAAATLLVSWHEPVVGDEGSSAIMVDLTPFVTPRSDSQQDLAPGPEEQQLQQPPEPPPEKTVEEEPKPKIEPPPVPEAEVTLPREEAKPEPPRPLPQPTVPTPTAPPRQRTASSAEVRSWHLGIVKQIEQHKGYPPSALARRETGITQLAFTLDRDGRVVDSRVVRSSGHPALDQEAMATVRRAQPFPPPPPDLAGANFDFTMPVKFNVK